MVAEQDASEYTYQNVGPIAPVPSGDASAYTYQNVGQAVTESRDASAYTYQNIGPSTPESRDASAYTYQNILTFDAQRVATSTVEAAIFGTDSRVTDATTTTEITVYGQVPPMRVAASTVEVAGFQWVGATRVYAETVEVAVYGNGSQPTVIGRDDGEQSGYTNIAPPCWPEPGSGAISSTVPGYVPTPGFYTTPVQIGSVSSLTCARLPSGRVALGWKDGSTYFVAVLDDAMDLFRDNVVAPSDRIMAISAPGLRYGSLWIDGAGLFCAISYINGDNIARNECWMATNAENPTTWMLRNRFQSVSIGGGGLVANVDECGPATITRTGRWVLPFPSYGGYATGTADRSSLWMSDNKGASWVLGPNHRRGPLSSGTTGPITNTVAQDPLTGYLYWNHHEGPLNTGFTHRSMDNGATWTNIATSSGHWAFYTDDGNSKMYAARASSGWRAYEVIDAATNSFSDTGIEIINSRQTWQFQAIRVGCYLAIIDTNRVAAGRLGSEPKWAIGYT